MTIEYLSYSAKPFPNFIFEGLEPRTAASYERELTQHRCTEIRLRAALARKEVALRQKDELIKQQEVSSKESDHRLLNGLQMIVSLLSLQSRASTSTETAAQLAVASNRVAMIERTHRRLHSSDGGQAVALTQYIQDLCRDLSTMLSSDESPERIIFVAGTEISLPATTAIPLGFILNELITNAAKHGKGRITVRLEPNPGKGYALSVSNDGPGLPAGFDPAACKGLGMKIIRSFVERIGGELQIGRGDRDRDTRFTVQFC